MVEKEKFKGRKLSDKLILKIGNIEPGQKIKIELNFIIQNIFIN